MDNKTLEDDEDKKIDLRKYMVPSFCPICEGVMWGKSTSTYYQYGCCVFCHLQYVEGREDVWKEGWRPTAEQVEADLAKWKDQYNP